MGLFKKRRKGDDVDEVEDVDAWLKTLDANVDQALGTGPTPEMAVLGTENQSVLASVGAPTAQSAGAAGAPPPPPSASDRRSEAGVDAQGQAGQDEFAVPPTAAGDDGVWHLPDFESTESSLVEPRYDTQPNPFENSETLAQAGSTDLGELDQLVPASLQATPHADLAPHALSDPEIPSGWSPIAPAPTHDIGAPSLAGLVPDSLLSGLDDGPEHPHPADAGVDLLAQFGVANDNSVGFVEGLPDLVLESPPQPIALAVDPVAVDPALTGFMVDSPDLAAPDTNIDMAAAFPDSEEFASTSFDESANFDQSPTPAPPAPWEMDQLMPAMPADADPFSATSGQQVPAATMSTEFTDVTDLPSYDLSAFGVVLESPDERLASDNAVRSNSTDHSASSIVIPQTEDSAILLAILGLDRSAAWDDVKATYHTLLADHSAVGQTDPVRAELALSIRREINSAYAGLRLCQG